MHWGGEPGNMIISDVQIYFVPANVDWVLSTSQIEFQAGGSVQECGCIEIINDAIIEDTENFGIEISTSAPGVIVAEPSQVVIEIEDDEGESSWQLPIHKKIEVSEHTCVCMFAEDTRLMFIEDTPRVTANSVTAELVIGRDYVSTRCRVTTQSWRDCNKLNFS